MVRWLMLCVPILVFMSLLVGSASAAEPQLRLQMPSTQLEMGKFLLVELIYQGPEDPGAGDRGESDLYPWSEDFYVDRRDREVIRLKDQTVRVTETLRLYPRRKGQLTLGAIASGGAILPPVTVEVLPARRGDVEINPHWSEIPRLPVWQGAPLRVSTTQTLTHPANQLVAEDWDLPGFEVRALPQQQYRQAGATLVEQGWILIPGGKGSFRLEPPALQQRGRGRWRFHLPALNLRVKPLPSYLPATVPVGKLQIHSRIVEHNDRAFWQLRLENEGLLPNQVYGVQAALARAAGTGPDEVAALEPEPLVEIMGNQIRSSRNYQVAIPRWSVGLDWLGVGSLSLPYFDTRSGTLRRLEYSLPVVWNAPRWAVVILLALVLLVVLWLLAKAWRLAIDWRKRRHFEQQLDSVSDPCELRTRLLDHAGAEAYGNWQGSRPLDAACFAKPADQGHNTTSLVRDLCWKTPR